MKIISEVYRKSADCCVSAIFFPVSVCISLERTCTHIYRQPGKEAYWFNQTLKFLSVITKQPPEMEGCSVLPSGSHHEELADGSCSCSQVGKQAGDWLAFPLDRAHLSGEFTTKPFHIGSLWDWAATRAKGSHFSPCAVSSLCLFSPSFEPELCSRTLLCYKSKRENKHI